MRAIDNKTLLFWGLVLGIFFIVFLFWIPSFIQSVTTLIQSVGSQTSESTSALEDTVTPQIEELKKTFDTLLKEMPTGAISVSPPNQEGAAAQPVLPKTDGETLKTPQGRCQQNGGIRQQRSSANLGEYAVCIFADGSECEEKMLEGQRCAKGQTMVAEDLIQQ